MTRFLRVCPFSGILSIVILCLIPFSVSATQQIHILALRVEFREEDPDDFTSGGNGLFDMRTPAEAMESTGGKAFRFPYDLPPHDGLFLERHLHALASYVHVASHGEMEITWEIYPPHPAAAYNTGEYLAQYGSGADDEQKLHGWVTLLKDAMDLCAADVGDLSRFQSFLVFNASVAMQGILSTELPPIALTAAEIARSGVQGIPSQVETAWLMPQQIQQPGGVIGLNGSFAKTFLATQGLPVLSNTSTGGASVGGWTLMDVGADNAIDRYKPGINPDSDTTYVLSFLPCLPMAWEQMRLGWLDPVTVRSDTVVSLAGLRVQNTSLPQAIKIPVSDTEYFLLELRNSRWADTKTHIPITYSIDDTSGVWLRPQNNEYDAYTPGSGVLVFHVDEDRIARWEPANEINTRADRPGIFLVEADGYRDVGITNYIGHPRANEGIGSRNDPFPITGEKVLYPDGEMEEGHQVSFANDGTLTGLKLEFEPYPGAVRDSVRVIVSWQTSSSLTARNARNIGGQIVEGVTVGAVGPDPGTNAVVAATEDGGIWVFDAASLEPLGSETGRIGTLPETPSRRPVIDSEGTVVVAGQYQAVRCVINSDTWTVSPLTSLSAEPPEDIQGDIDRDDSPQTITWDSQGILSSRKAGEQHWILGFTGGLVGQPTIGDVDNDGFGEVFAVEERRVNVVTRTGHSAMTYRLGVADSTDVFTGPALTVTHGAMVPGRNALYIFAGTEHPNAMKKIVFPGRITGTPAICEQNGLMHAVAGLEDGWLVSMAYTMTGTHVIWGQLGADGTGSGMLDESRLTTVTTPVTSLLPKERAFCYPSPVGNSTARLRFYLTHQADIEANVYTSAGELVWSETIAANETTARAYNEIVWPGGTAFASGLYICRVHAATAGGLSGNVVFPVAIAR